MTIAPSDEHRQSIFGTTDNIFPRFIVSAGYGGTAFSASPGLYRDCCRNLAMLEPAGERVSAKIRHTHSLRPRIAELVATIQRLAGKWSEVVGSKRTDPVSRHIYRERQLTGRPLGMLRPDSFTLWPTILMAREAQETSVWALLPVHCGYPLTTSQV